MRSAAALELPRRSTGRMTPSKSRTRGLSALPEARRSYVWGTYPVGLGHVRVPRMTWEYVCLSASHHWLRQAWSGVCGLAGWTCP
jgi:hypothetical protein